MSGYEILIAYVIVNYILTAYVSLRERDRNGNPMLNRRWALIGSFALSILAVPFVVIYELERLRDERIIRKAQMNRRRY